MVKVKYYNLLQLGHAAGLTACLFWNIVATTAAWIKGDGTAKKMFSSDEYMF